MEARHAEWLGLYQARLAHADSPKAKVLAVFRAYEDHAEHAYERGFRGCGILNAASELKAGDEGRQMVKAHKEEVEAILAMHLAEFWPDDAQKARDTAQHLSFLLEGAMARGGLEGSGRCVKQAMKIASSLLVAT